MSRVGAPVRLEHVVGVSVVGGDQAGAAGGVDGLDHFAQTPIDRLHRLDRGRDHARVTHHVGVGEVDDPEPWRVSPPGLGERRRRLGRAHRRLVVIGGNVARRGHELALLALVGLFSPPLKK